ncbi:MAG: hypothetical protein WA715_09620 [Candidatus Acidiferrum sp.]|jgi:hypothetical protein
MRRKAETHKPGTVLRIVDVPEVKEQQAEIRTDGADPLYGKVRIVNFLSDEAGKKIRLKEGDGVDVIFGSDDTKAK